MANSFWFDFEKDIFELTEQLEKAKVTHEQGKLDMTDMIQTIESKIKEAQKNTYSKLTGWQKVQISRHPERPYTLDYIEHICTDFVELFGDRQIKDDKAIVGGFAKIDGKPVMILGQQKGVLSVRCVYSRSSSNERVLTRLKRDCVLSCCNVSRIY